MANPKIVNKIKHLKFTHICCVCGKKLETYWDDGPDLVGNWWALDAHWSELLDDWVPSANEIECFECLAREGELDE